MSVKRERLFLHLYQAVVVLLLVLFLWWIYFFSVQGDLLLGRVREAGVELDAQAAEAVRAAAASSHRMLLFEGAFLGMLLVAGITLMLRAVRREVQLRQQQQDLISAVTHELKSPIAAARLQVETLQLGRVPEEKRARYLERTRLDLVRLSAMVDHLLESARMSHGLPELRLERLDLSEYVAKSATRIAHREAAGELELELDANDPVLVEADASALETILRNLIANTVKYGGENARLRLSVRRDDQGALLEARDYGPGLQDIDAKRALRPFRRGSEHIVKSRPGVGLGLYIVEQLTNALGGRLQAGNAAEGPGFAVRIHLPLAASPSTPNGPEVES